MYSKCAQSTRKVQVSDQESVSADTHYSLTRIGINTFNIKCHYLILLTILYDQYFALACNFISSIKPTALYKPVILI